MKNKIKTSKVYNYLNKDIKEFNSVILSLVCITILIGAGILSYNVTTSYALFTDEIIGNNTMEFSVSNCRNNPNKPVLSENMIPVYYDEETSTWKKADTTNRSQQYKWYDYCEKMWANSVTVSSANRQTYLEATPGTEISMNDILTMQVWIPRYKYKVWNYNSTGEVSSDPQEIEILFESGTTSSGEIKCTDNIQGTSNGTKTGEEPETSEVCKLKSNNETCTDSSCNGKTYTHPAFTLGNKELKGIWVGKFELSSDINCTPVDKGAIATGCNLTTIRPLVKPNMISWRGAMVSIFENDIMAMNDTGNKYGFLATDDTHMIKNNEWGAVAYLSHSKYGINQEISINSASTYTTGCGPQALNSTESGATCNAYNTPLGKSSSTTGNIYGIYDMSGSAYEHVMGNVVSPNGTTLITGNNTSLNSGYTGILHTTNTAEDYLSYSGTYSYPDNKYIDKYSFSNDGTISRSKLGDATKEIYNNNSLGWYDDYLYPARALYPWILRSGSYNEGVNIGIFNSRNNSGHAWNANSSRLAITE